MESIISTKEECFLCGSTQNLQTHHCWHGTGNRKLADKDGLFVRLCVYCHSALHDKGINDRYLMETAEKAYLAHFNATTEDFIKRYGKNVI